MNRILRAAFAAAALLSAACNRDDVLTDDVLPPVITLDSPTGVYTVKAGRSLTVAATVEHAEGARIAWTLGGEVVCREAVYTARWDETGAYYPVLHVENRSGKATAEIRVEVVPLTPPLISLTLPSGGLKVLAGAEYRFEPDFRYDDTDEFRVEWLRDGAVVAAQRTYTFRETEPGSYTLTVRASNADGQTERSFAVEVVATPAYTVAFPTPSLLQGATDRYTFAGRPLYLRPLVSRFDRPRFAWTVDGADAACGDRTFRFLPEKPGTYRVAVTVSEDAAAEQPLTEHVARTAAGVTAEVTVHCVAERESDRYRPAGAGSSPHQSRVFEWIPAPGQFINETATGGMTGNETTPEAAAAWAAERLAAGGFVSLGGFGGYIVVGFDHSIAAGGSYDFTVAGNAFVSPTGSSNEPGIVFVMQDVNGNGLPDDEWYELRGSETGLEGTLAEYAVTYFRPEGPGMDVAWEDSEGETGHIDYLPHFHRQDSYYPAWIGTDSYTLRGTRLPARNRLDPATGLWANEAFGWGYADNAGSDSFTSDAGTGSGQRTGFRIDRAMHPDGTPVELQYVDFIRVQTAVNAKSGTLGEVSTEVCGFTDQNLQNR